MVRRISDAVFVDQGVGGVHVSPVPFALEAKLDPVLAVQLLTNHDVEVAFSPPRQIGGNDLSGH